MNRLTVGIAVLVVAAGFLMSAVALIRASEQPYEPERIERTEPMSQVAYRDRAVAQTDDLERKLDRLSRQVSEVERRLRNVEHSCGGSNGGDLSTLEYKIQTLERDFRNLSNDLHTRNARLTQLSR